MTEATGNSRLVRAVFLAWKEAGVDFLVLRNYENLPEFTSNDIDVLVAPTSLSFAERVLLEAAHSVGFRLHNRAQFATLALYLSNKDSCEQAHFDLFTDLKWRGFDFLDCNDFLKKKVEKDLFSIPHPAHEAATNLLAYMIYTGTVKENYKPSIAAGFRGASADAIALLTRTYGEGHARFLVQAGGQERWTEIETMTGTLRRSMITRQLTRRPLRTLRSFCSQTLRLARRCLSPPGLCIVLCGPDGSGKSTAGKSVIEKLNGTFSPIKGASYHWKPPLFSAARRANRFPTSTPHDRPPRNALSSLLFFAFHWLEFFLGSGLRIRPITFRGGLVIIDRFYYDFFVDQRRYRLKVPQWLVRLGYSLLPKPDLVFLLDAPAELLQSRKAEVPLAETERQRQAYLELVRDLRQGRVINASQPPGKVGADIAESILEFLTGRTSSRARAYSDQTLRPAQPVRAQGKQVVDRISSQTKLMPEPHANFLSELFSAEPRQANSLSLEMRLLRKHGRPLLLLPPRGPAAVAALSLYPAQTNRARTLRALFSCALKFGLPLGTESVSISVSPEDPFVKFLSSMAANPARTLPELGMLVGNGAAENQRFILLLFNADRTPAAVVKCASSPQARALLQHEQAFLSAGAGKVQGIPQLRGNFESSRLYALAVDYFPGDSLRREAGLAFPSLLGSWVDSSRTMHVIESSGWLRLEQACAGNQMLSALRSKLERAMVHPAIYHGDFVPWNIRVGPDSQWTVLDWERGEISGLPTWDVFHYLLQPAILVQRLPLSALESRVEQLLVSDRFRAYVARAGIAGFERELLLAYLLHSTEVIRPSEGLGETKALFNELCTKWMLHAKNVEDSVPH
jgi:thymidylate kinase